MRAKSVVLIMIALGCGLVASIGISQVMERNRGEGRVDMVKIFVAASDINLNEQFDSENIRLEEWPVAKVPEGAMTDMDELLEKYALMRFYEGEPIVEHKLATEPPTASIRIPDGFRVCSLKVRADTANSGLVQPGDRVDIIGFFRAGNEIPRTSTRTILRNVPVFAVNSETEQVIDQEGRTMEARTVSLLVNRTQDETLMLAKELGTLSLSLRRPHEMAADEAETDGVTVEELFGMQSDDPGVDEPQGLGAGERLAAMGSGLARFIASMNDRPEPQPPAPDIFPEDELEPEEPEWQMMMMTPDGITQFAWNDATQLPEIVQNGTMTTPGSAIPSVPPSAFPLEEETPEESWRDEEDIDDTGADDMDGDWRDTDSLDEEAADEEGAVDEESRAPIDDA